MSPTRDLTAELALDLSVAAAHVLGEVGAFEGHRPVAVVGRDPRASGEFLEAAVVAGLASAGVDVLRVGVLPTPAVAYLTGALGADLGVMLSACHNPMPDNGIKFFARGGHKLADEIEDRIEEPTTACLRRALGPADRRRGRPHPGLRRGRSTATSRHLRRRPAQPARRPQGRRRLRARRGLPGLARGVRPGRRRGRHDRRRRPTASTSTTAAAPPTWSRCAPPCVEHGADLGIAHDGDADRCLAVDAAGEEVDGDQILAVLALAMRERGTPARATPSSPP